MSFFSSKVKRRLTSYLDWLKLRNSNHSFRKYHKVYLLGKKTRSKIFGNYFVIIQKMFWSPLSFYLYLKTTENQRFSRSNRWQMFLKIGVLKNCANFANFTGKHLCWSLFLKKRPQHRCFPVKFARFLRTSFLYRTPLVAASSFLLFLDGIQRCIQNPVIKILNFCFSILFIVFLYYLRQLRSINMYICIYVAILFIYTVLSLFLVNF